MSFVNRIGLAVSRSVGWLEQGSRKKVLWPLLFDYAIGHILPSNSKDIIMKPNMQFAVSQSRRLVIRPFIVFVLVILAFGLQACAGLSPNYETPTVTVSSFKALPSDGALPAFAIGLRVINPNREALNLQGIAYTVSLDGYEIIKGVGNDLPVVEGYGEGEFNLTASANLFAGMRLIAGLLSSNKETFAYELEAKLDIGTFRPAIRVKDAGEIDLRSAANR